jgi:NAD(P)-dependent dehydrogenase (short-subunit alcohol dehydrogenase family)
MNLDERSVVIRAYTPDVAFGLAQGLASRGMRVVISTEASIIQELSDLFGSEKELKKSVRWIQTRSQEDPLEEAQSLQTSALEHLESVDALVFEGAARYRGSLLSLTASDWQKESANLESAFFHAITFAKSMQERGGVIVFLAGIDVAHAYSNRGTAAILDGGFIGMTRALAVELASFNIRVNTIARGIIQGLHLNPIDSDLEKISLRLPMGRLGDMDEFCAALSFVLSDRAEFMTGQLLKVDGGWSSLNQAPDGLRFP